MNTTPFHQPEFIRLLTYTGALEFDDGVDTAALITHLADHLRKLDGRDIKISRASVSFRGGLFRGVNNWNILVPFGYGELIADETTHEVRYRLSFRQLICAATALLGLAFVIGWSAAKFEPVVPLVVGFAWLWLVGGNLMLGIPRFQRFLQDAIDSLPVRQ